MQLEGYVSIDKSKINEKDFYYLEQLLLSLSKNNDVEMKEESNYNGTGVNVVHFDYDCNASVIQVNKVLRSVMKVGAYRDCLVDVDLSLYKKNRNKSVSFLYGYSQGKITVEKSISKYTMYAS